MDATSEIKQRLDIVDLIGEYLPLKPAGAGAYKALCPFHQERTPSFYVSRTRQSWRCFGCNEGGDQFSFVQKLEGMDFRESLEFLAQKVGYQLPEFDGEKSSQKKRLQEVNDLAMRYFRSALRNLPQAEEARKYLTRRGLDDLTIDLFQLGYAPESWSALIDALMKKGVTADELVKAGLAIKRERDEGIFDRFRNRVMFPIHDVHGHVVGFTGRILSEDKKEAKYMNTPETSLYRKSAVLYGLEKAKGEIRRLDMVVIVEGNMDVISSHQFGMTNVVASSGTALTAEQLSLLKRFTTHLAIAFDADAAGQTATLRGLDIARQQDFSIKLISLPPEAGKDPDEAIRKDPNLWKQAIADALEIMEWVYRRAFKGRNISSPEDKKLIAKDVLGEIQRITDPIERDHWLRRLAKDLDASVDALMQALKRTPTASSPAPSKAPAQKQVAEETVKEAIFTGEHHLLALSLSRMELLWLLLQEPASAPDLFELLDCQALYKALILAYDPAVHPHLPLTGNVIQPPVGLEPAVATTFDALAFLAERDYRALNLEEAKKELQTRIHVLRIKRRQLERERLEEEMRRAERIGDQQQIVLLMQRFQALRDSS